MTSKWPELLKEIAPGLKRAAMMFNPDTAPDVRPFFLPSFEAVATCEPLDASTPKCFD
jgi:putative ABC transport system substrate-binding protein